MFKQIIASSLIATASLAAPLTAHAAYPEHPIKLIVPFSPGGSTDILGRLLAKALQPILGQTVVVENKVGAAGNIGGAAVAQAKPDGYTLLLAAAGPTVINPSLYKDMSFSPIKDLAPITALTREHNMMVVNPEVPANTLQEFIAYAKKHPGTISYGSPGTGTPGHLAGQLLNQKAGIDMLHVPYKGTGPAITDLLANRINAMIDNMPPLLPHVKSGQLRALALPSASRAEAVPELPTFEEAGVDDYVVMAWKGLMAPKDTPPEIIQKLHAACVEVLNQPDIQERLTQLGAEPEGNTPEAFGEQIRNETAWWADLIKQTNTTLQ
ncbi:tripartite tricarboxylate transporter substrate binding protein [Pusillimonas sp. SM2304]|uniref:Bug family tripartite tricarboxylate transporter substrate binding protein n=1 Tax=Pusillimonas sp. SM2304 TaxID=3073241 RepID=UPI0028743648|nr:tripartite tricarboxylate transporter substrate binding protein [Pusillimonas sp. SM2304]MDS1139486.1 tripartite tricarboxylate transporter substrate binding protein [Pusillimonas sp. SM2304]